MTTEDIKTRTEMSVASLHKKADETGVFGALFTPSQLRDVENRKDLTAIQFGFLDDRVVTKEA